VARQQTVTGLLYKAAEGFPPGTRLPEAVLFALMARVKIIMNRNLLLGEVEREVLDMLRSGGLHPVVMKGSTCAARYPSPELRTGGDVDLFIGKDEFPQAMERLRTRGIGCTARPDGSVEFSRGGCQVELHRRYFDLHVREKVLPPVGTPEAELLMLSAHIRKHACGVGVGLRQIYDFALAWRAYPGDDDKMYALFRRCGMARWNALLLSFIRDYLFPEMDVRGYVNPRKLFRIVRDGGNFGHFRPKRLEMLSGQSSLKRKFHTAKRLLQRLPFSIRYAPREIIPHVSELFRGNLH
jgi:hypothetical protein